VCDNHVRKGPKLRDCHQIVTKVGAKQAKINKLQKTEIIAILQLAKGFS
jgi:hypothetical protein